jgi:serine/threonine-protein kinase
MGADPRAELDAVLKRAFELAGAERERFLDEVCGRGTTQRTTVDRLLHAGESDQADLRPGDGASGPLWESLAADYAGLPTLTPGERLGAYRVVRMVGRGGTSTVYRAERADGQFEQSVALKVLDATRHYAELAARFDRERRILATLEHPGIARLIDGGTTAAGNPYVVMEFVDGEPIDVYCDRSCLTVDRRIDLFLRVADAVEYAHRHLIVHRDIKPSNILVTREGQPKLLDFGIAKLLDAESRGGAAHTRGAQPMTPEYASPEQVRGQLLTTASDVYQLGFLLYRLLTGAAPYATDRVDLVATVRAICEEEPARPAANVGSAAAAARGTTTERLRRRLAGDLDNILLKALRKEPAARYASISQLREELRRHLDGLPVQARQPTVGYRAAKFVQRHRVGVAMSAAAIALLVGGAVSLAVAYGQARRSELAARAAEAQSGAINAFLGDILASPRPSASGAKTLMTEVLDQAEARLPERFGGQPALATQVAAILADSYDSLARFEQAMRLREGILEQRAAGWEAGDPDTVERAIELATGYAELSRFEEAEALLEQVRARIEPQSPGGARLAVLADSAEGFLAFRKGDMDEASALYERAARASRGLMTADDDAYRTIEYRRLTARLNLGETQAAEADVRALLADARARFGERHSETMRARNILVYVLHERGTLEEAEREARANVELAESWLGPDDMFTIMTQSTLANVLVALDRPEEALAVNQSALEHARRTLGEAHPYSLTLLGNVANRLEHLGRTREAEAAYREAIALTTDSLGADHRQTLLKRGNLAVMWAATGRTRDAEAELRAVTAGLERDLGPSSGDTLYFKAELGAVMRAHGDSTAAVALLEPALAAAVEAHGEDSSLTLRLREVLADARSERPPAAQAAAK